MVPEGSFARHFGWMFVGQGTGYVLRAAYFVLIARLLGVLQYGVVVGAIALVNMVTNYSRLGSSIVFIRHVSADRSQFAVYWGNILLVNAGHEQLPDRGIAFCCPSLDCSCECRSDHSDSHCELPL